MMKTPEPSAPRRALGRGLSALLPAREVPLPAGSEGQVLKVPLHLIDPNPYQPRRIFSPERLEELAQSLRSDGLIQPIVVRRNGSRYTLIVGERRCRAAKLAGWAELPALVQEIPADWLLEVTLIENIQREDLNPIEEALAYRRLVDDFQLKQEDIAAAVGKDRTSVANYLRLLKLPEEVRNEVASGRLSMGHARALVALAGEADQLRTARDVIARGLSVRETESLVKKIADGAAPPREAARLRPVDVHTRAAEDRLRLVLGTRVRIVRRGTRGRLEIDFGSEEELIRLYEQLTDRSVRP